ncbi:MAG: UvrD-helicase domain-containing protein [Bacteroidales bacterium]|nr:UvrD-helicase domain-containing protein [Bacteroidales bacterium]
MIEIVKASAGSGKTFTLARTYLEIIFRMKKEGRDSSFRNILAVTFTNKATAEMKNRILRELHRLSVSPGESRFTRFFVPEIFPDEAQLQKASSQILTDILHDYGAFAVSTIDKFFQQTLRSFAREMGHFTPYQIELDRQSLIHEAVDRMLDSLTGEDTELLDWMSENLAAQVESGGKVSVEKTLYEIAEKLKSVDMVRERISRDELRKIRTECDKVISSFESRYAEAFPEKYAKRQGGGHITFDTKKEREALSDAYPAYNTAWLIRSQIWGLGIAQEFFLRFDELLREKNLMCLDESNYLLRDIIDDCKAPFVYEKTGVRYESFLLDEFQDTSVVQWENFRPLLEESESQGYRSLVVGDVKQSIYRWRASEWNLLARELGAQFPSASVRSLVCNWRSTAQIVNFNNDFFAFAAERLGKQEIYADVVQEPRFHDDREGLVELDFCRKEETGDHIIASVRRALDAGARYSDIVVLVRSNLNGSAVASLLIDNNIPVITDDSLSLKNSRVVRRLVSLLSSMENPDDRVSGYLARSLDIELPSSYHSIPDLCETLLAALMARNPELADGEVLFIQSFMDVVQDWVAVYGNNLRSFLRWWKDADECISSPSGVESVRVMTIHKAKGLEFNYVILPYISGVPLYKASTMWCRPVLPPGSELDHWYPVKLEKYTAESAFGEAFAREADRQLVDNLNILYVAMTRAVYGLHVIGTTPSVTALKAIEKDPDSYEVKNLGELIYLYSRTHGAVHGSMPSLSDIRRQESGCPTVPLNYRSYPFPPNLKVGGVRLEEGARRDGLVRHAILSSVLRPSDLEPAVDAAVRSGDLSMSERDDCLDFLSRAIASRPEWFPEEPGDIRFNNEVSLITSDGQNRRPDRVIIAPDGSVTVIDYKFGREEKAHRRQVEEYMALYRELGYEQVHGYLWYLSENNVIFVG